MVHCLNDLMCCLLQQSLFMRSASSKAQRRGFLWLEDWCKRRGCCCQYGAALQAPPSRRCRCLPRLPNVSDGSCCAVATNGGRVQRMHSLPLCVLANAGLARAPSVSSVSDSSASSASLP